MSNGLLIFPEVVNKFVDITPADVRIDLHNNWRQYASTCDCHGFVWDDIDTFPSADGRSIECPITRYGLGYA